MSHIIHSAASHHSMTHTGVSMHSQDVDQSEEKNISATEYELVAR